MPVEVQVGDTTKRYEMVNGKASIPVAADQKVLVDPQGLILKEH